MLFLRRISYQLMRSYKLRPSTLLAAKKLKFSTSINTNFNRNFYTNTRLQEYHEESCYINDDEVFDSEEDFNNILSQDHPLLVKDILYPNSTDPLINDIKKCSCVQDVLNFINKFSNILDYTHHAQIVLVLWDLQKMFCHINTITNEKPEIKALLNDYICQLLDQEEIKILLESIKEDEFEDANVLSATLLYLHKIGLDVGHDSMQKLIRELEGKLCDDFSIIGASRYTQTVFSNYNLASYFYCKNLIPHIYNFIDKCETAEDIRSMSICLNNLNKIVTDEVLEKYKNKVRGLIENGVINKDEHVTILKIVMFLNFPHWRYRNTLLISQCVMQLQNRIGILNVYQLINVFDVLLKNYEPAEIVNETQRCALKFLHQLDSDQAGSLEVRLKLLSCIASFSLPSQRPQFINIVKKFMDYDMSGQNLLDFFKVLLYMKNSDPLLCKSYWTKLLKEMEHNLEFKNAYLLKVCNNYINFHQSTNLRHLKLEKRLNQWLEGEIEQGIINYIPSRFAMLSSFVLAYGNDVSILNHVVNKLSSQWQQINTVDCYNLSRSFQIGLYQSQNRLLQPRYVNVLNATIDKCMKRDLQEHEEINLGKLQLLIKTMMCRGTGRSKHTVSKLLQAKVNSEDMCSRIIKYMSYALLSSNFFLPNILDAMADYVSRSKNHVMAINAEKVMYLCYNCGYIPKNSEKFFTSFSDLIVRDQERMPGLSYIQSCLGLSYFNYLSDTFIKQIFTPHFLEKLDAELLNCYSKDIYSERVRNRLMLLNRAVCIDYPESNVPWFHQKYIDEVERKATLISQNAFYDRSFSFKVKLYLIKYFQNSKNILSDVITPYGYHIDYVVQAKEDVKYAVLLMRPKAFTKLHVQLRGMYQTKVRHLEMFGYKVAFVHFDEWKDLVYGEDKINYIRNLFEPNICETNK